MRKHLGTGVTSLTALLIACTFGGLADEGDRTDAVRAAIVGGTARNVLLFIGDGMGDSEITTARNYAVGAAGRLALDTLPMTGAMTTHAVLESDPRKPDYVPDSAATATAWATGEKTSDRRIATSAKADRDLETIFEIARKRGYVTGLVTTSEITDATPATLSAHVASRYCHGPKDMADCPQDRKSAGGPGSIAEQQITRGIAVLLGGGAARYAQPTDAGRTVLDDARAAGYRIVTTARELRGVTRAPVLGLFAPVNMTTDWTGDEAIPYPSNRATPQVCAQDQRPAGEPSLAEMTARALELTDRPGRTGPGLFLQIEGALIDKSAHSANPCAQIGETLGFDRAIKVGLDFARTHPDTLVIVTADHGHATQVVEIPDDVDHPTGLISVLTTADGAPMALAYGTNRYHVSQEHTGTQVRIAAIGPQAANVVGVTDQTDLFRTLLRTLRPAAPAAP